jgi:hypothetical protein
MSEQVEAHLLEEIAQLRDEIARLKGEKSEEAVIPKIKPSYSFSSMTERKLKELLPVKRVFYQESKFDSWLNSSIELTEDETSFLTNLLKKRKERIEVYNEQTLSIKFIGSILNRVDFEIDKDEISDFYDYSLTFEFEEFIFNGEPDFFVAKGIDDPQNPYFFIQEFKKTKDPKYPEPQLVAELITAVEINSWQEIKGAFIVGINWHFVILEKVENRYQYYVSEPLLVTRIDDLTLIYKSLLFVKNEIIELVDKERAK